MGRRRRAPSCRSISGPAPHRTDTKPTPARSGVELVSFFADQSTPDVFDYRTSVKDSRLNGAVITTVKNVSRDVNNAQAVPLINVSLRDRKGATITRPTVLPPGAGTGEFAGREVQGDWKARATNISNAFLQSPASIELEVAWERP